MAEQDGLVDLRKTVYKRTNDLRDGYLELDKKFDLLKLEVELSRKSPMVISAWWSTLSAISLVTVAITLIIAAFRG